MSDSYHRVMGIDYGSVRIGIALSDPLKIIAQGLTTIPNNDDAIRTIAALAEEHSVERIIVGDPLTLKGERTAKALEAGSFVDELKKTIPLPIDMMDERFTSVMAQRSMMTMGMKKKQRREGKGKVDEIAAAILLQSYLDTVKR